MANWLLVFYLFNGTPTPVMETLYFESGSACRQLCVAKAEAGLYHDKPVVHCTCRRGNEFYGYQTATGGQAAR